MNAIFLFYFKTLCLSYRERSSRTSWILWFISTLKNIKFSLNLIDWFLFSFASWFTLISIHLSQYKERGQSWELILRQLHFLIFIFEKTLKIIQIFLFFSFENIGLGQGHWIFCPDLQNDAYQGIADPRDLIGCSNFRMNLWSHRFSQNMNQNFCPVLCHTTGQKSLQCLFIFWEKRWLHLWIHDQ